jgi:hypothetical protein
LAICDRRRFERRVAASALANAVPSGLFRGSGGHAVEPSPQHGFISQQSIPGTFMMHRPKKSIRSKQTLPRPLVAALAVAVFGVMGMLIVDHGPWNRPKVQTAEIVNYTTTGAAARAAGATVTPTAPKLEVEPVAPGPKPAQPANPTPP